MYLDHFVSDRPPQELGWYIFVVGVVFFIVTARRYRYRQRDEFCNIPKYIEDCYEKAVQHNPRTKELIVNFD